MFFRTEKGHNQTALSLLGDTDPGRGMGLSVGAGDATTGFLSALSPEPSLPQTPLSPHPAQHPQEPPCSRLASSSLSVASQRLAQPSVPIARFPAPLISVSQAMGVTGSGCWPAHQESVLGAQGR